jgi:hypothetical protein
MLSDGNPLVFIVLVNAQNIHPEIIFLSPSRAKQVIMGET